MTLLNSNAEKIVRLAEQELGSPYVFGAIGELCTPKNRSRRINANHPTIKSACQALNGDIHPRDLVRDEDGILTTENCIGCKWAGKRMYDCRGFTYWLLLQVGIVISTVGATTQYNTSKSWIRRGNIINMPDVVCCVFVQNGNKMSHTGMHIGGGTVIDCSTGVTRKTIKGFTHFAIPRGLYSESELYDAEVLKYVEPLRKGSKGPEVEKLQKMLNSIGYDCGAVDGVFGSKTFNAVVQFQADSDLEVDGVVGDKTMKKIEAEYNCDIPEKEDPPEEPYVEIKLKKSLVEELKKVLDNVEGC